jgi:hypothetical protein
VSRSGGVGLVEDEAWQVVSLLAFLVQKYKY